MTQRAAQVNDLDVERLVRREFPESMRPAAMEALSLYRGPEAARARAAAMRLSGGDMQQLKRHIQIANEDYRDVLAWAEYPSYGKARTDSQRQAAINADWQSYSEWFGGSDGTSASP